MLLLAGLHNNSTSFSLTTTNNAELTSRPVLHLSKKHVDLQKDNKQYCTSNGKCRIINNNNNCPLSKTTRLSWQLVAEKQIQSLSVFVSMYTFN